MVPRPLQANAAKPTKYGVIYFGSTSPAMDEAIGLLEAKGHHLDRLRIRAFPFHSSVASFIADHDFVYVVEQNRDGQLRQLIVNENGIDPVRLVPILHYDGTPITARFIAKAIGMLEARGHQLDRLRIRAFPFHSSVASFIADHDFVYVVEQNRDGQLRQLIVNENGIEIGRAHV